MIPPVLRNLDTVKLQHSVISTLRDGMKDHLVGVHESKIVMAKDILCTLVTNSNIGSGRGLVALLGIDRRNIIQAKDRGLLLDSSKDAFWLHYRRKIQADKLADNVRAVVEQWWCNETTISSNRKDTVFSHRWTEAMGVSLNSLFAMLISVLSSLFLTICTLSKLFFREGALWSLQISYYLCLVPLSSKFPYLAWTLHPLDAKDSLRCSEMLFGCT